MKKLALVLVLGACVGSAGFACTSSPKASSPQASTPTPDVCAEAEHDLDAAFSFMAIAGFDMANNSGPPAAVHLREVYDKVVAAGVVVVSDTGVSNHLNVAAGMLKQAIHDMKHDRLASGKRLAHLANTQLASARQLMHVTQCSS